jgi:MarR family transcriptional regulator for hemolysin
MRRRSETQSLGLLMNDISRLARKEFDRRVRDLGLTRAQWLFLFFLERNPGCTQSELAELLQLEKITVSRQATRLVRAGLVERRDDAGDARAYRLQVTRRAGPLLERLSDHADQLRSEYLRGVSASRHSALLRDLQRIKSNLLGMESNLRPSRFHEKN